MATLLSAAGPVPRLRLNTVLDRRGTVDGAWWPRTSDAAAELPALISAVDQRLDRAVLRVGLYLDAWDHIPRRIPARGREVRVAWFRSADPHLITLSIAGTVPITLLVIPPGTADGPAMAALAFAAADTAGVRPADILHPAALGVPGREPGTGVYRFKTRTHGLSWRFFGSTRRLGGIR